MPEYVGNGMFKGESIQKAAEHWANWCDVRCMTGLSEFLRVVAARAPADSVTAHQRDTGYPPLPECDATTVGLGAVWNRHSMRAYVDADRKARAQADSQPAQLK